MKESTKRTLIAERQPKFKKSMLQDGDILVNRNGDIKVIKYGRIFELKSKSLGYGRGFAPDHIGHNLDSHLRHPDRMFKVYDIVKVIRDCKAILINQ